MKKILLLMFIFTFLFLVLSGAEDINDSGTSNNTKNNSQNNQDKINLTEINSKTTKLPNQFGYGFERFLENIRLFFTLSQESRVEYKIKLSEKRIIELNSVIKENLTEYAQKLVKDYNQTILGIKNDLRDFEKQGENINQLQQNVSNITYKHILILQANLDKVPENTQERLLNAIQSAKNAHLEIQESILKRQGKTEGEILRNRLDIIREIDKKIKNKTQNQERICIQVITPAKSPKTGECKNFPTPCDVPQGWNRVSRCGKDKNQTNQTI